VSFSQAIPPRKASTGALSLETFHLTKVFGDFTAMDAVSMKVEPGTVHALLGENGAGKSTVVKCVSGFQTADAGSVLIDGREQSIANPAVARALGIGMVYQHFTLAPGMSVAENLLLASHKLPLRINWREQKADLQAFLASTPFKLDLDACPSELAAGEKQKLEILKQLYLQPRLLILDEPTSVLTPQEADEVLGHIRAIAHSGACSVIIITHKFREVMAYADTVTVLRKGKAVQHAKVADTNPQALAAAMMGDTTTHDTPSTSLSGTPTSTMAHAMAVRPQHQHQHQNQTPSPGAAPSIQAALGVEHLSAMGDRGAMAVDAVNLKVQCGEILGVAGIAGNGQRELMQALVGQRPRSGGAVKVAGEHYTASRRENSRLKVRSLPEEPLRNACVQSMSVAENMALRDFDQAPLCRSVFLGGWLDFAAWRQRARQWITDYGVKTQGENAPISSLSGGNMQRAVLARELDGPIKVLIAANPVFGLDFAAVQEIHARILAVKQQGAGVLLISEDLDELLELSDRIVVMSEGRIVFETPSALADRHQLGAYMGGAQHEASTPKTRTS
jgi:general nucleoside transport system ATP-binding protein